MELSAYQVVRAAQLWGACPNAWRRGGKLGQLLAGQPGKFLPSEAADHCGWGRTIVVHAGSIRDAPQSPVIGVLASVAVYAICLALPAILKVL